MTSSERSVPPAVTLAIQRVGVLTAPDDRTAPFDISPAVVDGALVLEGVVDTTMARRRLREAVERVSPYPVRDELSVLEQRGTTQTTDRRAVPVRGEPADDAEQVTQVLYGGAITVYDRRNAWRRVRVPDGYVGWVHEETLVSTGVDERWQPNAVVQYPHESAPAGTACRLLEGTAVGGTATSGDTCVVGFRTGERATLPAASVRRTETIGSETTLGDGEDVVAIARRFLETPYEWGGITTDGIDCSGLVWIAYAGVGVTMPRDADQQRALGTAVDRDALAPGDLLFFPGHVAISLGGSTYIHAYGGAEEVTINSLDPDDEHYVADLDDGLEATNRLLGESLICE